jgi:hypothetical protein
MREVPSPTIATLAKTIGARTFARPRAFAPGMKLRSPVRDEET